MFKRSVNFSPYEKDKLLQLIRQYIVIFEDKRLDGVGRREKERAWLDLTDKYNSTGNINPRTSKQLQSCWKNLKNRARDVTEACKRGDELPYFSGTKNPSTSYLPYNGVCSNLDEYKVYVKNEQFSDVDYDDIEEPPENTGSGLPASSSYSVSSSPTSVLAESPPITNYVYSPSAPLPYSIASASSEPAASVSSPPQSPSQDGSHIERLSASRVPYTVPSYRAPERSISKTVDRIANSILFERGVQEPPPSVFEEMPFDQCTPSVQNKADKEMAVPKRSMYTDSGQSPKRFHQVPHTQAKLPFIKRRKYGHAQRPVTCYSPSALSSARPEVNGHPSVTSGRVSKAGRYRRLEHEARMRNLRHERECLEIEHKLRCQLMQLKIEHYRQKTGQDCTASNPL